LASAYQRWPISTAKESPPARIGWLRTAFQILRRQDGNQVHVWLLDRIHVKVEQDLELRI